VGGGVECDAGAPVDRHRLSTTQSLRQRRSLASQGRCSTSAPSGPPSSRMRELGGERAVTANGQPSIEGWP
jgi:hypothetical protein